MGISDYLKIENNKLYLYLDGDRTFKELSNIEDIERVVQAIDGRIKAEDLRLLTISSQSQEFVNSICTIRNLLELKLFLRSLLNCSTWEDVCSSVTTAYNIPPNVFSFSNIDEWKFYFYPKTIRIFNSLKDNAKKWKKEGFELDQKLNRDKITMLDRIVKQKGYYSSIDLFNIITMFSVVSGIEYFFYGEKRPPNFESSKHIVYNVIHQLLQMRNEDDGISVMSTWVTCSVESGFSCGIFMDEIRKNFKGSKDSKDSKEGLYEKIMSSCLGEDNRTFYEIFIEKYSNGNKNFLLEDSSLDCIAKAIRKKDQFFMYAVLLCELEKDMKLEDELKTKIFAHKKVREALVDVCIDEENFIRALANRFGECFCGDKNVKTEEYIMKLKADKVAKDSIEIASKQCEDAKGLLGPNYNVSEKRKCLLKECISSLLQEIFKEEKNGKIDINCRKFAEHIFSNNLLTKNFCSFEDIVNTVVLFFKHIYKLELKKAFTESYKTYYINTTLRDGINKMHEA